MQFVDLAERPILARYAAVGQMNFVPGIWDPTWAPGQVGSSADPTRCCPSSAKHGMAVLEIMLSCRC